MRGKITALAAGTLLAAFGIPASASAAEPGFTADPQSPAGVEYQVPLDSARGQGGGGAGHHGGGGPLSGGGGGGGGGGTTSAAGSNAASNSPTLFGSGITAATGGTGSAGSGASTGGDHNGGGRSTAGQTSGSGGNGGGDKAAALSRAATASYSSTGPVAGIVGAILLVGGGLGIFLRLRARPRRIFS